VTKKGPKGKEGKEIKGKKKEIAKKKKISFLE